MIRKEFILSAAIHYDDSLRHKQQPENVRTGFIVTGRRHSDCYATIEAIAGTDIGLKKKIDNILHNRSHQGFITSTNRYVSRAEAFKIAKANDQIIHHMFDKVDEGELTSEDLY
jgi:predicted hotdog family 3-hydroxylacyl-ACP dehydratase